MTPEQAKGQADRWNELHGLAEAEGDAGNFEAAEAYRMQAADIELDLVDAGFNAAQLAATSPKEKIMITTPSLEAVLALDGRNFAMLSIEEREALQFYQDQGRKFDVSVAILSDADPKELELASRAQADDIMKRANSHVQITLGPDAQERFKLMRLCKEHGRSEEFYVIKPNE